MWSWAHDECVVYTVRGVRGNVCGMCTCFLVCARSYVSIALPKVQLQLQKTLWSSLLQQYIVQVTAIMAIWMF